MNTIQTTVDNRIDWALARSTASEITKRLKTALMKDRAALILVLPDGTVEARYLQADKRPPLKTIQRRVGGNVCPVDQKTPYRGIEAYALDDCPSDTQPNRGAAEFLQYTDGMIRGPVVILYRFSS